MAEDIKRLIDDLVLAMIEPIDEDEVEAAQATLLAAYPQAIGKPYGYGCVDKHGKCAVVSTHSKEVAESDGPRLDRLFPEDGPHIVVELRWHEVKS